MGVAHKSTHSYVVWDATEADFCATDHVYAMLAGQTYSLTTFHTNCMTFCTVPPTSKFKTSLLNCWPSPAGGGLPEFTSP